MRHRPWLWTVVGIVALLLFNALTSPGFFRIELKEGNLFGSLIDVLNNGAPTMLLALGMTLVIATGGVDLSVGAVMAIAAAIAAMRANAGATMPEIVVITLGVAALCGFWNAMLVAWLRLQPIVATLILMVMGRGVAQLMTDGQIITFRHLGLARLGDGFLVGLPVSLTLVAGMLTLLWLMSRRTALGTMTEAVGDNPGAANYTGIPVNLVLFFAYVALGLCAGLAGMLAAAETRAADANNVGLYLELDAILAVVLGGTPLIGGKMNFAGSILGAIFIQALTTSILTRGAPVEWTLVVKAVAVLAVCLLQSTAFRSQLRWVRSGT